MIKHAAQARCDRCGRSYRTYFEHKSGTEALDALRVNGWIVQRDGKCYCGETCRKVVKRG